MHTARYVGTRQLYADDAVRSQVRRIGFDAGALALPLVVQLLTKMAGRGIAHALPCAGGDSFFLALKLTR